MTDQDLIDLAISARERAYAPYSKFKVGAALLSRTGRVYAGCNVENAAFTPTICAERTAIVKAVSEGEHDFDAIAVATETGVSPCGVCRQVMKEFAPDMRVVIADTSGNFRVTTVRELLPDAFGPPDLTITQQS